MGASERGKTCPHVNELIVRVVEDIFIFLDISMNNQQQVDKHVERAWNSFVGIELDVYEYHKIATAK